MIQIDDQMGLNHQIVALFLKLLRIFEFNYFSSITLNQNQRFPFLFREQWPPHFGPHQKYLSTPNYLNYYLHYIPVVPHKAVAEVSRIGNV